MRRSSVALITLVGSFVLAACSGDNATTSPRGISPQASSKTAFLSLSCNFTTMNQDAKLYFASGSNKDIVFDSIANMKKLYGSTANAAAATLTGFNILARTAVVRDNGLQIGAAAAGGKFVLDVVGCMAVLPIDTTFKPDKALDNGIFEVQGGSDNAAVIGLLSSVGHAATISTPRWGAEPNGTWERPAWSYGKYLVYGYPLGSDVTAAGFEMGTVPQSISRNITDPALLFRVGLCVPPANGTLSANRLVHANAIVTGLFDPSSTLDQGTKFCAGHVNPVSSTSWFGTLASRTISLFSPAPLFALTDAFDGIGGLPDGWSPITPNAITGTNVTLTFGALPTAAVDSVPFSLVVHASAPDFPNVPGVTVTLSVANNSGVPASAVLIPSSPQAVTDKNGDATFSIAIGKPGGYTLTAVGVLSTTVQTLAFTSASFNVKN